MEALRRTRLDDDDEDDVCGCGGGERNPLRRCDRSGWLAVDVGGIPVNGDDGLGSGANKGIFAEGRCEWDICPDFGLMSIIMHFFLSSPSNDEAHRIRLLH